MKANQFTDDTDKEKMLYTVWDSFETLVSIANIFTNTESKETGGNDRQFKIIIIIKIASKSLE